MITATAICLLLFGLIAATVMDRMSIQPGRWADLVVIIPCCVGVGLLIAVALILVVRWMP